MSDVMGVYKQQNKSSFILRSMFLIIEYTGLVSIIFKIILLQWTSYFRKGSFKIIQNYIRLYCYEPYMQ